MQEKVLDVCCGAKMFWFDKQDPRAEYLDNRCEEHRLKDSTDRRGYQPLLIDPDYIADFRNLPYDANTWPLVVFDPPHFKRNGKSGWLHKKY